MDSIKWKCKNWIVNVKKFNCRKVEHVQLSSNFFLFHCTKVGRVQLSSNFFPLLSLISPSRMRFEYVLAMWRKKHTLRDVISLLYRDKNKKDKSLKRILLFDWTRHLATANQSNHLQNYLPWMIISTRT